MTWRFRQPGIYHGPVQALPLLVCLCLSCRRLPVTHTRRFLVCACFAALLAASAPASAPYRGPAPGHSHVVVRAGYYRPYYYHPLVSPHYYNPLYFGFGVYYNALWGGYPYAAPYAYGYPYAYPYPYYYSSWASARIEVKPRDAQVFIDGYYVGVVDQFDGVQIGRASCRE